MNAQQPPQRPTYTRELIIAELRIEPCHVTGTHEPNHHLKYVCDLQREQAFKRVVRMLGITEDDLPRALHDARCGWCHEPSVQERYRAKQREWYEWAGVPLPRAFKAKGTPT